MKECYLTKLLMITACLTFISTTCYAYGVNYTIIAYDTSTDWEGVGTAYATYYPATAGAEITIYEEDIDDWAEGEGYACRKLWITDYNNETLNAECECWCSATGGAYYDIENSDYVLSVTGCSYAGEYTAFASIYLSDPEDGDLDTDYFYQEIDMSYSGATLYYGEYAYASVYAYSTSNHLELETDSGANASITIVEE